MFSHQLPSTFQVLLFKGFCPADEGFLHRLHPDQIPHPDIFRNVCTERRVRCTYRIDLAAGRAP